MSRGFRRVRGDVVARFSAPEVELLTIAFADVLALLGETPGERPGADPLEALVGVAREVPPAPDDPALARLLPDAYRDDADAAGEFRRLTDASLRATKREALQAALADLAPLAGGGTLDLAAERGELWLAALNDVRLVLGVRFDVTEEIYEEMATLAEDDPRIPGLAVYDWMTGLQETLVQALARW